jgi:hypothetical protein
VVEQRFRLEKSYIDGRPAQPVCASSQQLGFGKQNINANELLMVRGGVTRQRTGNIGRGSLVQRGSCIIGIRQLGQGSHLDHLAVLSQSEKPRVNRQQNYLKRNNTPRAKNPVRARVPRDQNTEEFLKRQQDMGENRTNLDDLEAARVRIVIVRASAPFPEV